jgi:hypothetical protein
MEGVPTEIVMRQIEHFARADTAYGIGVASRMVLNVDYLRRDHTAA